MIRKCTNSDIDQILGVINDSALAYKGIIPTELYREPFVSCEYLSSEIKDGVTFYGHYDSKNNLIGVMGCQDRGDVILIRHSYVLSSNRHKGVGSALIEHFIDRTDLPILVGCLKAMTWAISFYQKHGFQLLSDSDRDYLRAKYWKLPEAHVRQSVVLANSKWLSS